MIQTQSNETNRTTPTPSPARERRRPGRRIAIGLAALAAAALTAAGCGTAVDAISLVNSGEQVDIGGRELFLRCQGTGSPTVILEHGLESNATAWQTVQEDLSDQTRVCLTSRAGMSFSDPIPGDGTRTAQDAVDDLVAVLDVAEVPGPYVMVGHSFGGYTVRLFADQHPDDVVAMVLVDSSHEDQAGRLQQQVSPEAWTETEAFLNGGNSERMDFAASGAQVAATGPLGDLPLTVLERSDNPDNPSEIDQALAELWPGLQTELAALSTNSTHTVVPDSGHFIQIDQPDIVAEAIRTIIP